MGKVAGEGLSATGSVDRDSQGGLVCPEPEPGTPGRGASVSESPEPQNCKGSPLVQGVLQGRGVWG